MKWGTQIFMTGELVIGVLPTTAKIFDVTSLLAKVKGTSLGAAFQCLQGQERLDRGVACRQTSTCRRGITWDACVQSSSHVQPPEPKRSHEVFFLSQNQHKILPLYINIFIYMTPSFSHCCSFVSVETGMQTSKILYKAFKELKHVLGCIWISYLHRLL